MATVGVAVLNDTMQMVQEIKRHNWKSGIPDKTFNRPYQEKENVRTAHLKDGTQTDLPECLKLDVFLMHEDLPAGLRGKRALAGVTERLEFKTDFDLSLWKFNLLNDLMLRVQAVNEAREANIMMLAVQGAELPSSVRTWLKQWLQSRRRVPCAIIVSLDSEAQTLTPPHPALVLARCVAETAGMDFFPHYSDTPQMPADWMDHHRHSSGSLVDNSFQSGQRVWSTYD